MTHRHFPRCAFEEEGLIRHFERVAVVKVDFDLRCTGFMAQCVDIDVLLFTVIVNIFEDGVELVHGINTVSLTSAFFAARAAHGRLQGYIRIGIDRDEIEFKFRRDNRLPPALLVFREDLLQLVARGERDGRIISIERIADDLCGRLLIPRHKAHGVIVGHHVNVAIRGADEFALGIITRDGLDEDGLGNGHTALT